MESWICYSTEYDGSKYFRQVFLRHVAIGFVFKGTLLSLLPRGVLWFMMVSFVLLKSLLDFIIIIVDVLSYFLFIHIVFCLLSCCSLLARSLDWPGSLHEPLSKYCWKTASATFLNYNSISTEMGGIRKTLLIMVFEFLRFICE